MKALTTHRECATVDSWQGPFYLGSRRTKGHEAAEANRGGSHQNKSIRERTLEAPRAYVVRAEGGLKVVGRTSKSATFLDTLRHSCVHATSSRPPRERAPLRRLRVAAKRGHSTRQCRPGFGRLTTVSVVSRRRRTRRLCYRPEYSTRRRQSEALRQFRRSRLPNVPAIGRDQFRPRQNLLRQRRESLSRKFNASTLGEQREAQSRFVTFWRGVCKDVLAAGAVRSHSAAIAEVRFRFSFAARCICFAFASGRRFIMKPPGPPLPITGFFVRCRKRGQRTSFPRR
jgi:hypothetical protein